MHYKIFTNNKDNRNLILFFNGWAMTPESIEHLAIPDNYDLVVIWDYRDDIFPQNIISNYENIIIVAWSMGVWAANRFMSNNMALHKNKVRQSISVCGTAYPMHDEYGIPKDIFEATLNGLNDSNREKFNRRMCGGKSLKKLFDTLKKRPTLEIKDELKRVHQISVSNNENKIYDDIAGHLWTKVWIAGDDRIIPKENQLRYWQNKCNCINILEKTSHFLFKDMNKWEDLF